MTHVRMDRMHEGVKVFGEQVIGHLDAPTASSTASPASTSLIPAGLGTQEPKLSSKDALAIAQKEFGGQDGPASPPWSASSTRTPTASTTRPTAWS